MTHKSYVNHIYPVKNGIDPWLELDLDWCSNVPASVTMDMERYPRLIITEIGQHKQADWPIIRVVGPLRSLAMWVRDEYMDGNANTALEILANAVLPGSNTREDKTT